MSKRLAVCTPGPWLNPPEKPNAVVATSSPLDSLLGLDTENFAIFTNPADAVLAAAAPEMYEALKFARKFFLDLENGTEEDDPLTKIRRDFHAPMHKVLDAAIAKAEGVTA